MIEKKLAALPIAVQMQLPGGETVGASNPAMKLIVKDRATLVNFATGQAGHLGEDYVEGRFEVEGSMRNLMKLAAAILDQNPVDAAKGSWLTALVRHLVSIRRHSTTRDAEQIQFHYDLSDEFYALWLDPRRVYSCAYFREPDMALAQAQEATRALRPLREQMDTSNRVLRSGMVNLAVDIEQDIAEALADLSRDLQGLEPGNQLAQQTDADPINQAAADASALRRELEALQEQISNGQQESIGQMRERLARSQQLAQQLDQQLSQAGEQQAGEGQPSRGQLAQRGQQGNPGNQAQAGSAASQVDPGDQRGIGRIPAEGEAALWGNARSISTEITSQSLEAFMNQPELLQGVLQPLIELESDLRARAELARITRRLYTVSEEDIPEEYRQLVEAYYRALSENRSATP